jgi:hypothetical protein
MRSMPPLIRSECVAIPHRASRRVYRHRQHLKLSASNLASNDLGPAILLPLQDAQRATAQAWPKIDGDLPCSALRHTDLRHGAALEISVSLLYPWHMRLAGSVIKRGCRPSVPPT